MKYLLKKNHDMNSQRAANELTHAKFCPTQALLAKNDTSSSPNRAHFKL